MSEQLDALQMANRLQSVWSPQRDIATLFDECADELRRQHAELTRLRAELAEARKDTAIGAVVWRFIDRMNDVADCDPADKILAEFVAAVQPAIDAALDALSKAQS